MKLRQTIVVFCLIALLARVKPVQAQLADSDIDKFLDDDDLDYDQEESMIPSLMKIPNHL